jgi:hypothetical protein
MPEAPAWDFALEAGKPEHLPTCYSGAVRLRALPPGTKIPGIKDRKGEFFFALEASPEPRLQWVYLAAMQIDKAVDDQGQSLSAPAPLTPRPEEDDTDAVSRPTMIIVGGKRLIPVRLKKGEKASHSLKEIRGRLSAQVRTEPAAIVTVDNVLKAAGKTVKGESGGAVKVVQIGRDDDGRLVLRVELEMPAGFEPAAGIVKPLDKTAAPSGARFRTGLALFDAKGRPIPLGTTLAQIRTMGNLTVHYYTFTAAPAQGQPEPAKLAFYVKRTVTVDVPFTLKDVPLPQ